MAQTGSSDFRSSQEPIELALPLDIPLAQEAVRQSRGFRTHGGGVHANLLNAQSRITFVAFAMIAVFLVVALRLTDSMILDGKYETQPTDPNSMKAIEPGDKVSPRADILDRTGTMLATSLPTQSLYADPKRIIDAEATAGALVKTLPDLSYEEVLAKLKSQKRFVWIKRHLSPDDVFKTNALGEPGLEFQDDYMRLYPAGADAVQVLGYTDVDGHGLAGIERGQNSRLVTENAPMTLALDLRLQHIVKREVQKGIDAFSAIGGAGVVMDITTGEVLAGVSLPDFNPLQAGVASDEARFNRFALGTYELGSMFKIMNTAAAFESGRITMNSFYDASAPIHIGRFRISDFEPERRALSVGEILIHSSNIGSARMALDFGPAYQKEFLCKLGLCDTLTTELSENAHPLIPNPWREVNAMTIAFGHGISVTPMHLMRAVASILNGGRLITPTFLKRSEGAGPDGPQVVSMKTVWQVRKLLRANAVLGSGKNANVPGFFVGGKTGTAEKTQGKSYSKNARISSFIGAFPMDNPKYLILVMIDEPRPNAKSYGFATGGWVSAPVVGRIVEQMTTLYAIPPRPLDDEAARKALELVIPSRKEVLDSY